MRTPLALCILALPVLLLVDRARGQDPEEVPAPAGPTLADLAWISGDWAAVEGRMEMEELWTAPKGDLILGLHRDWRQGARRASFEYLRIEARAGAIVYLASPGGGAVTEFVLTELEGQRAVFENAEHDFPQRIVYAREGEVLSARVEDLQGERSVSWSWALR